MRKVVGRDPGTGESLSVTYSDRIESVENISSQDLPWLSPGLIDLQVNGYGGHDVNGTEASVEAIEAITDQLAQVGVTTWIPTVISASEEAISRSLALVSEAKAKSPIVNHAVPFVHVEGPFISDQDGPRGAHPLEKIRPIDSQEVERWMAYGPLGYITVSPHWEDSAEQIRRIRGLGVHVAIGHTHATTEQIQEAASAGADLATHLGNGIFASLPRHPNPIWAQLADDRLDAGFIGDGHHMPAETLTAMIRAKGDRSFLVSDSAMLAGTTPGRYRNDIGGEVELFENGRLEQSSSGLLAGSGVNLLDVVRYTFNNTPFSLDRVLTMAVAHPARLAERMGASPRGKIEVGYPADLITLDDKAQVLNVIQAGKSIL